MMLPVKMKYLLWHFGVWQRICGRFKRHKKGVVSWSFFEECWLCGESSRGKKVLPKVIIL